MSDTPTVPGTPEASEAATETNSVVTPTPTSEPAPTESAEPTEAQASAASVPAEPGAEAPASTVDAAAQEPAAVEPTEVVPQEAHAKTENVTAEAANAPVPVGSKLDLSSPTIVGHISPDEFAKAQEAAKKQREEERERKEQERAQRDAAFAELDMLKQNNASFEVTILERVKGGLRCEFKGVRVFLPASQFGLRKNVSEDELAAAVGTTVTVKVHELQSDDAGYKSAVVSRKELQLDSFWSGIEVGAVLEGTVTTITPFGAFVNVGGAEGLVHISRMSKQRLTSPSEVTKKGAKLKVTVVEVDREKKKMSLSHREHEVDAWEGIDKLFPIGTVVRGVVRRITDFGAYVQVASRIEGLVRISELSWTQRVKHPSDILKVDQEIDVVVLDINTAKHQLSLGYKQTQPNPWSTAEQSLAIGTSVTGIVQQVSAQGALLRVLDTFDGFMPRSKMILHGQDKKITVSAGDSIECIVVDLNPLAASLILAMKNEDGTAFSMASGARNSEGEGGEGRRRGPRDSHRSGADRRHDSDGGGNFAAYEGNKGNASGVTIADLLREADKSNLNG